MSGNEHSKELEPVAETELEQGAAANRNAGQDGRRRRFLKGGLAVAPVVITLASRPAWGNHCTVSGMLSGNLSNPHRDVPCRGRTPGYWGEHPYQWPSPYDPGDCAGGTSGIHCTDNAYVGGTPFHAIFAGSRHGSLSLMQVVHLQGNDDRYQLGAHSVAALLNAAYFGLEAFGYRETDIIQMFNDNYATQPEALKNTFQLLNERDY